MFFKLCDYFLFALFAHLVQELKRLIRFSMIILLKEDTSVARAKISKRNLDFSSAAGFVAGILTFW